MRLFLLTLLFVGCEPEYPLTKPYPTIDTARFTIVNRDGVPIELSDAAPNVDCRCVCGNGPPPTPIRSCPPEGCNYTDWSYEVTP